MVELVICGRGGQGVVFLTRLIGEVLTAKGLGVVSSETHGMAVRGGSINSHLRVGSFYSPLIRPGCADILLSMDTAETGNNLHFLKPGGLLIENATLPNESLIKRVDASGLARELGRVQLENVVLLGFASGVANFPISFEDIRSRLEKDHREAIRSMNLKALEAGIKAADKK